MIEWFIRYWYLVFSIGGSVLYVAWQVRSNRANLPIGKKMFFTLAPVLDPNSDSKRSLTPRAIWLAIIGVLLALLASLLVFILR